MENSGQVNIALLLATGMFTLLLLAGGVVLFFIIYQKRLLRQQLLLREVEAAYKEELLHSNIEQVEAERKRVAKDLHDEVGSIFSTLRLKMTQLSNAGLETDNKMLQESRDIIDAGLKSVRRISHDILPPSLELFGLPDALEDLCSKLTGGPEMTAVFTADADFPRMDQKIELGLYRVVQELVNNCIRHAEASKITLHLQHKGTNIVLIYSDNGKGFNPELLQGAKGLGLKNIEARISQIKGKVEWVTQPGQGLKTIITIPLDSGT